MGGVHRFPWAIGVDSTELKRFRPSGGHSTRRGNVYDVDTTSRQDPYDRKPTSDSRGRTHERILGMQRANGTLPGADELLADAPAGSIGAAVLGFLVDWVEHRSVTSRRAYERSLVLLVRDCAEHGPALDSPASALNAARLAQHLAWRIDNGLNNPTELIRCAVHVSRLADWLDEHHGAQVNASREDLRQLALDLIDEHRLGDLDAPVS